MLPGKFRVRHYSVDLDRTRIPVAELEAYLDANDLARADDPAAALRQRFPAMPDGAWQTCTIIDDGRRRRNTHRFPTLQDRDDVTVANGREVVNHYVFNGQVDINGGQVPSVVVLGLRDFCAWPAAPGDGRSNGAVRREEADGRLTVERRAGDLVERWVVDRRTGFVRARSTRPAKAGPGGELIRQYGPKTHGEGVVLPTVHVRVDRSRSDMDALQVTVIEGVELGYRPSPLDFVVAAPAGTIVIDNRGGGSMGAMDATQYPVADVVAFAEGKRAIDPALRVGDPAPAIGPARWLDREGRPAEPPALAGKVVLVAFSAKPRTPFPTYMLTVPSELKSAAERLGDRGKGLVIVELGGSEGRAEEWPDEPVVAFARDRGIAFPRAVDRAASEAGWAGATFEDFGVRADAGIAVIDREGKVAYVGEQLSEAIDEAAKRLGPP